MNELDIKIERLKKLIYQDMNHPKIRVLAQQITKGKTTDLEKARAIYNWIKQNIRYVREPEGLDLYQSPALTVELGRGDCEDASALFASIAKLSGLNVKLKVIAQKPTLWSHIYPLVLINDKYLPYDNAAPIPMEKEVTYLKSREYYV
jgi:transglutaminase-like putative cysteine protease